MGHLVQNNESGPRISSVAYPPLFTLASTLLGFLGQILDCVSSSVQDLSCIPCKVPCTWIGLYTHFNTKYSFRVLQIQFFKN